MSKIVITKFAVLTLSIPEFKALAILLLNFNAFVDEMDLTGEQEDLLDDMFDKLPPLSEIEKL